MRMNVHVPNAQMTRYRAIWISDVHLGTSRAQADALLNFFRCTQSDHLYLVGDIVDNWALKKTWHWHQSHNDVIQKILRKARKGTRVVYIPGNHDEQFRDFAGSRFGRLVVKQNDIHVGVDGTRYLVMHGDEFDGMVKYAMWLAYAGDTAYEVAMSFNHSLNWTRRKLGLPAVLVFAFQPEEPGQKGGGVPVELRKSDGARSAAPWNRRCDLRACARTGDAHH